MRFEFHLSIGVKSILESVDFFVSVLGAQVLHRDPSGYVNIDAFGAQITLKDNPTIHPEFPDFHFGFNLSLPDFDRVTEQIMVRHRRFVHMAPTTVDAGTPLERRKMYLKCPTGYLLELKGYR